MSLTRAARAISFSQTSSSAARATETLDENIAEPIANSHAVLGQRRLARLPLIAAALARSVSRLLLRIVGAAAAPAAALPGGAGICRIAALALNLDSVRRLDHK